MQSGQPSRTALAAAIHRAAHQVLEGGTIFPDPLAMRILGEDAEALVREVRDDAFGRALRQFVVVRSRITEDALAEAVRQGTRQLVILGAGLDTCAYRAAHGATLRVFEVDFPATQAWKRERLASAGIELPSGLVFAPVDFERQTLAQGLAAAGLERSEPTFFTWLGVVPYLTPEAFFATLEYIALWPRQAQVVFDYANAPAALTGAHRAEHEALAERVAAAGEPFRNFLVTEELHVRLAALGLTVIEDLGPKQIAARFSPERLPYMQDRGGHILRARTSAP
jgi:methyltransferase (TIGR00027 family)